MTTPSPPSPTTTNPHQRKSLSLPLSECSPHEISPPKSNNPVSIPSHYPKSTLSFPPTLLKPALEIRAAGAGWDGWWRGVGMQFFLRVDGGCGCEVGSLRYLVEGIGITGCGDGWVHASAGAGVGG